MKLTRIQIGDQVFPVVPVDTDDLQYFGCKCTKHDQVMDYVPPKDGYYPECRCPVPECGRKVIKSPDGTLIYCFDSAVEAHEYAKSCLGPKLVRQWKLSRNSCFRVWPS